MYHAFVGRGPTIADADAFERKLYVIRKRFETEIEDSGLDDHKFFYFASLSCRTLVYKGMLTPDQLGAYFADDLGDERLVSALCMFHSRFSTNTFPSWELAHPYRMISHNGEINTLRGNINWMRAREALFESDLYEPGDVKKLLPIIREGLSDTACLDNAVELLVKSGYGLAHADDDADPRGVGEPRDDVAGEEGLLRLPQLPDGALGRPRVDRLHRRQGHRRRPRPQRPAAQPLLGHQGRPGRSWPPRSACSTIPPEEVVLKGRLEPGKMFLVDIEQGRIVDDEELKHSIATAKPYGKWLREHDGPAGRGPRGAPRPRPGPRDPAPPPAGLRLHPGGPQVHPRPDGQQRRGGDRLDGDRHPAGRPLRPPAAALQLLQAALRAGDQPAARRDPRGAGHLGPHRRRGRGQPARCPTPESCRQIALDIPILDNDELARLKLLDGWRGLQVGHPADALPRRRGGRRGWKRPSKPLFEMATEAIERGSNLLILSDRGVDARLRADPVAAGLRRACTTTWSARACGPAPG